MKHALISLFLSIAIICSTVTAQKQFQTGGAHLGTYSDAAIHHDVSLLWKFGTEGAVRSTPAIASQMIVFGSSDGYVYCLTTEGTLRWKFKTDGPVSSSPAIENGIVYIMSRRNTLYALQLTKGNVSWKKTLGASLPYEWGFDYYVGSPSIEKGTIYIGSADGNLYALNAKNGTERWKHKVPSPIRSTPAFDGAAVYFGDCTGTAYSLDKSDGTLRWSFSTIGDTLVNDQFGFDRKALIASLTLYGDQVFIGGRDGFLYAVDRSSGTLRWKYDYQVSWIISTVAVKNDILVTGTSDGRFVHALRTTDGTQLWRFNTQGPVWASPALTGNNIVLISSNDGYVYALELTSGKELWRFKVGPQIFSSTVPVGNQLYFGSDDGYFYALNTTKSTLLKPTGIKRAVFWMKDPIVQSFRSGMDVSLRDYFIREGYEFYDETDVATYLRDRIQSDTASVLVFATNYFPPSLTNDTLGSNLLQAYMKSGGRVVVLGLNPASYQLDSAKKQVIGLNFLQAKEQTGIPYRYKDLRTHGGFYSSSITDEGKRWGMKTPFVAIAGMPLSDITTPLAIDENGNATAWVKTFSQRKNSGYLQLYLTADRLHLLPEMQRAIEFGLGNIE